MLERFIFKKVKKGFSIIFFVKVEGCLVFIVYWFREEVERGVLWIGFDMLGYIMVSFV